MDGKRNGRRPRVLRAYRRPAGQAAGRGKRESRRERHERLLREDPEYAWRMRVNPWRTSSFRYEGALKRQALAALVLFAAVWALFQWRHPLAGAGQAFVRAALTEEMNLEAAYAWYEERFGPLPAFVPVWKRLDPEARLAGAGSGRAYVAPAAGAVVEPFGGARSGAGVVIRTEGMSVSSMDEGLVLFAGETEETGRTVVIRHPGGVESVYGFLGSVSVRVDDWVEAGQTIGTVRPQGSGAGGGHLYFAVKHGDAFVDPLDLVAL